MKKYLIYLEPDESSKNVLRDLVDSNNLIIRKSLHVTISGFYSCSGLEKLTSEFKKFGDEAGVSLVCKSGFLGITSFNKENALEKLVITLANPEIKKLHLDILDKFGNYINSKDDGYVIFPFSDEFEKRYFYFGENYVPHITLADAHLTPTIKYAFFNNYLSRNIYFDKLIFSYKENDEWKTLAETRI